MFFVLVFLLVSGAPAVFSDVCKEGQCYPGESCCPSGIPGEYSCCPFEYGVCCSDNTCCPQNSYCDAIRGACITDTKDPEDLRPVNKLEKRQGLTVEESSYDGKQGSCQSGETCCPSDAPGDCMCCPYSNAVCCEGYDFCCPENYECDFAEGVCNPKEMSARLEKRQGIIDEEEAFKKQCSDGSICADDTTCCTVAGGKFGCCPHLHATCCPDMIHCCPQNQKCDVTSRYCVGKQTISESTDKRPAFPIDY